jgi:hypothetical protein
MAGADIPQVQAAHHVAPPPPSRAPYALGFALLALGALGVLLQSFKATEWASDTVAYSVGGSVGALGLGIAAGTRIARSGTSAPAAGPVDIEEGLRQAQEAVDNLNFRTIVEGRRAELEAKSQALLRTIEEKQNRLRGLTADATLTEGRELVQLLPAARQLYATQAHLASSPYTGSGAIRAVSAVYKPFYYAVNQAVDTEIELLMHQGLLIDRRQPLQTQLDNAATYVQTAQTGALTRQRAAARLYGLIKAQIAAAAIPLPQEWEG